MMLKPEINKAIHGDCLDVMKEMADKALNMCNEAEVVALVKKTLKLD